MLQWVPERERKKERKKRQLPPKFLYLDPAKNHRQERHEKQKIDMIVGTITRTHSWFEYLFFIEATIILVHVQRYLVLLYPK